MNHWIKRITFLMLILPMAMCQAETEKYQAGVHYEVLPQPIRTADATKIEVNEVFSYTCGHCFNFETVLHPWSKNLAADVDFQQTPAVWQSSLEPFARAYYSAVMLNVLDQTHMAIFEALHVKKQPLRSEADFATIFDAAGVDGLRFSKAYNSFGMTSMVNQAKARVRGYRVQGTPEVIVNGKYRVSSRNAGGFEGMLNVADFLIEKERNAKAK
ncbi:thiol:disulfide interchange protein DsbA/DsbL [bacterium]|jgi:thiol:disulfide interchange protein DsbA|nr:thiol:disulfide interchange protein DsbA/DsbL [Porticoccaceae bacterium]MDB4309008.1 thiol:disulfide interchange protein DsbA/DsbL [Porticoccaceae bacterium]MDB4322316.1 thiol:disulfide interchange protein DsbA/DsbL [bacterium]MDB9953005.1 thiol:disulfide interchange protein DsbA/DsbL [Porticoccaceae bacterium]